MVGLESDSPTVRPATVEDAEAIGRAHVTAWQVAYRGDLPDDFLDGMSVTARADWWRTILGSGRQAWPEHPGRGDFGEHRADVLVVEDDSGAVVGVASVGVPRDDVPDGTGELWLINLAPEAWGHGYGRSLLEAATDQLRRLGYRQAYLWVLDSNERARHVYEKAGWRPDGGEKLDTVGGHALRELRYARPLL